MRKVVFETYQNITLLHSKNCAFRWLGDIFHKGKFGDGNFVGGTSIHRAIILLFLVLTGLHTANDVDVLSYRQSAGKTRGASPNDTRDVVTFVVGAVDRQKHVANFAIEGCCAVHRRFADVAVQFHCVGVDGFVTGQNVLHKNCQQQFGVGFHKFVVATQLANDGYFVAISNQARQKMLGKGYGQGVVVAGKAWHGKFDNVEVFPKDGVGVGWLANDCAG